MAFAPADVAHPGASAASGLCSARGPMQKPQSARENYFSGGFEPGSGLRRHSPNELRGGAMGSQSSFSENDRLTAGARPDLPPSLQHALGWLKHRLDRPIVLDDLAAAAGVRPRTLEAHFKLHLGTTPMGWVRRTATRACAPATARLQRRRATSPRSPMPTDLPSLAALPRSIAGNSANCRRRP